MRTLRDRDPQLRRGQQHEITLAVLRAERATGVDAWLLLAVIEQESRYDPRAKGPRGALGLMQVRPATGRAVAEGSGISWRGDRSLFDPSTNVLIGATYLAEQHERFGSWDLALTAYNRGPSRARPPSRYAATVLRRADSFRRGN